MPQHNTNPDKREMFHMPLALHSAKRAFGNSRVCAFACVALTDNHNTIMGWRVFLENWMPQRYDETREEIAAKHYLGCDWIDALHDYLNRCRNSGLDAGFDFEQLCGLGGKE